MRVSNYHHISARVGVFSCHIIVMEEKEDTTEAEDTAPLRINDRCEVKWRGGQQNLPAVVIARRTSCNKRKRGDTVDLDSLPADAIEYYVHYVDHDRCVNLEKAGCRRFGFRERRNLLTCSFCHEFCSRLDEWVTYDKFLLDTLQRHEAGDDEEPESNARAMRRRSSMSSMNDGSSNADFSFSGGNWHGSTNTSRSSGSSI